MSATENPNELYTTTTQIRKAQHFKLVKLSNEIKEQHGRNVSVSELHRMAIDFFLESGSVNIL